MTQSTVGLTKLFEASSVAVIGASAAQSSGGGRFLHHLRTYGYTGEVIPVNPRYDEIDGLKCYASLSDVPGPVDVAVIAVRAAFVPDLVSECGSKGVKFALVHSDGFGAASDELATKLERAWRDSGVRIIGPNTNGLRATATGLFADASSGLASGGADSAPVAIIAQSGGLGGYLGPIALRRRGMGFRYLIDTGNELDVNAAEALEYFADDDSVAVIGMVLESCRDGRRMVAATRRAVANGKSVIILRLATTAASTAAAASHSGAIGGNAAVFQQALADAGAKVCLSSRQFCDAVLIAGRGKVPANNGVGVVTGSGGFAVLAGDLGDRVGLHLPAVTGEPPVHLREKLPLATFSNPLDLSAAAAEGADAVWGAVSYLTAQPEIGSLVLWEPHALLNDRKRDMVLAGLAKAAEIATVPMFLCGLTTVETRDDLYAKHGITTFDSPDDLFNALGLLAGRPPGNGPAEEPAAHAPAGGDAPATALPAVVGREAREVLQRARDLRLVPQRDVTSAADAVAFSASLDAPAMLKVLDATHVHKSDLGLVIGPVAGDEIFPAYDELAHRRDALGLSSPITAEAYLPGVEVAIGAITDESFGRVVVVGAGGRLVELLRDVSFAPAPVDAEQARRMLRRLAMYPLLTGYRKAAVADVEALVRAIVSVSELVSDETFTFKEVDINPVMVDESGKGVTAVDWVLIPAEVQR